MTSFDLRLFILTKKELEKKLEAHRDVLRKMGVASPAVFGYIARNESTHQIDIDLLVDFDHDVGLFHSFKPSTGCKKLSVCPRLTRFRRAQYILYCGYELYQRRLMWRRL